MSWGRSRSVGLAKSIWTGFLLLLSLTQAVVARSTPLPPSAAVMGKQTVPAPVSPPTPPPPTLPAVLQEVPNNPLAAPPNIDELLRVRLSEDIWVAMYSMLISMTLG